MKKEFFDSSLEANSYDFPEFRLFFNKMKRFLIDIIVNFWANFANFSGQKFFLFIVDHCTHVSAYSLYTFNFYKSSLCRLKAKKQMQVVYFL